MLLANKLIGFQFSFGQVAEDTFIALLSFAFFNQKKKMIVDCVDDFSIFQIFNLCVLFEEAKTDHGFIARTSRLLAVYHLWSYSTSKSLF
ncbi:MAG: hypothetical protein ACI8RD_011881 [Bacillariaceae sp.]|jgi:hypothetical protein